MSTWQETTVTCPQCATELSTRIALGVHVTRMPEVREQVLSRTFHTLMCSSCATRIEIARSLVYTDFDRNQWLLVGSTTDEPMWPAWEQRLRTDLARAFEHGSPLVHKLGEAIFSRVVFGYEALREKLVIWAAALEDAIVECIKLRLVSGNPTLAAPGSRLLVDRISDDDSIHFAWFANAADHAPQRELTTPPHWVADTDSDHTSLEARFQELFTGSYISFRRLASATL